MQQITRAIYVVNANEIVTVEIEATKVGNFITFSVDGVLLTPKSETPRAYEFQVSIGAAATHFGIISCHFPQTAPDDAAYQVFVSGDKGGGKFTGSDIVKTDFSWDRNIEFRRI
ncbi:MAG TPA: hypothetical protein VF599_21160 [Pyrinomonadaceae bacterium]|jgi:hypothetical protein